MARIQAARAAEQKLILHTQLLGCFSTVIYLGGPVLVALAAFATYVRRLGPGDVGMTAAVAFPALAFFDLMRPPIIMLPMQIQSVINAAVALGRMQRFVDAPELVVPPLRAPRGGAGCGGSRFPAGRWPPSPPTPARGEVR